MRKLVVVFLIFKIHFILPSESSCVNCSCQNDQIRCQPQQDIITTKLCLNTQTCENAIQMEIINIKKIVLTNNLFENFTKIESLQISHSGYLQIVPESFNHLRKLQKLNMNTNNLIQCHSSKSVKPKLNHDSLKGCLKNLHNLNELHLQNNKISEV